MPPKRPSKPGASLEHFGFSKKIKKTASSSTAATAEDPEPDVNNNVTSSVTATIDGGKNVFGFIDLFGFIDVRDLQ